MNELTNVPATQLARVSGYMKQGWLLDFAVVGEAHMVAHIHNCAVYELRHVLPAVLRYVINKDNEESSLQGRVNWTNLSAYVLNDHYPLFFVRDIAEGIQRIEERLDWIHQHPTRVNAFRALENELTNRMKIYLRTGEFPARSTELLMTLFTSAHVR